MSESFPLRPLPQPTPRGAGGGGRWLHRALPELPYRSVAPMYPRDNHYVWRRLETDVRLSLRLPTLTEAPDGRDYFPPDPPDMYGTANAGSFVPLSAHSSSDRRTVPDDNHAFWGGSFVTKPHLSRAGVQ